MFPKSVVPVVSTGYASGCGWPVPWNASHRASFTRAKLTQPVFGQA